MEDQPPPSETLDSPPASVHADHVPSSSSDSSAGHLLCRSGSFSRLNARAPEFVPRPPPQGAPHAPRLVIPAPAAAAAPPPGLVQVFSPPNSPYHVPVQVPVQGPNNHHHHHHHGQYHAYHQHHHQHHHHGDNDSQRTPSDSDHAAPSKNSMSEEAKIVNQVEYYFSDVNLATTDHLIRFISKDPEGYVPLSVVASFKKIKSFTNNHSQLAAILRNSKKLVVSEDGKKVKRQHPLTESDMEELQSRIVIAENLPEDHCYQNLMKIFSAFGSVKSIRTCQPQPSNSGASSASRSAKADNLLFSNKLHAFVEYETVELAEKAVSGLNDEGSWRSSLRLRLLKRMPNQVRGRKGHEGDVNCDEGDASTSEQHPNELSEDPSRQSESHPHEHAGEEHLYDREGGHRKGCNRGRAKGRGRAHYHHINNNNHNHGSSAGTALLNGGLPNNDHLSVAKQPPGPRMPDGTRGFGMGRGKPVAAHTE